MEETNITVTFYERRLDKELPLVNIFYRFNGTPIDFAKRLCDWFLDQTVTNGYFEESIDIANGCGCMVAQYIKFSKRGAGGMYIYPFDKTFYKHAKFNYHIIIDGDISKLPCNANEITTIKISKFGDSIIYTGTPKELLAYINKQNEDK